MKTTIFNATCPFEIGDKIKSRRTISPGEASPFKLLSPAVIEEVHTITDIVCEHSVKHGTVTFLYELDNSGKLVQIIAAGKEQTQPAPPAAEVGQTKPVPTATTNGLPPEFERFIKKRFG